ncbi:hypothetical protein ACFB49_07080 [Sphingomonas sp. DBB INV C78]|uniref:hypothetical protein n=1 Tax=Sphingomonas sp. DBB INV C78 TaxID=3349434 RepID=UPI0036D2AB14
MSAVSDDPYYLEKRAEQEIELAQSATHPAAVRAHYLLAGHYLDKLYGEPEEAEQSATSSKAA